MSTPPKFSKIAHFVEDELQRAAQIWDQLLVAVLEQSRKKQNAKTRLLRNDDTDLPLILQRNAARMGAAYLDSLHAQARQAPPTAPPPPADIERRGGSKKLVLELVDLDSIALDVELSKLIQAIKDEAEDELRDLQALLATLVGDADVEQDHNPLHPAVHGRALRDAALVLPLPLAQQLGFVRMASALFAQLLRQGYAASCSRLARAGVEPALHRCVVSPDGTRALHGLPDVAYVPDLQRIRDAMPTRRAVARPAAGAPAQRSGRSGACDWPVARRGGAHRRARGRCA